MSYMINSIDAKVGSFIYFYARFKHNDFGFLQAVRKKFKLIGLYLVLLSLIFLGLYLSDWTFSYSSNQGNV